jgi:hypothetical protein
MPRAEQSKAGSILAFFRTTALETAELVLGLAQDEVRGRKQKSAQAKARFTATPGTAPAAAPAKGKKTKGKKGKKVAAPAPPADAAQPGLAQATGEVVAGEYGEAGDLSDQSVSVGG